MRVSASIGSGGPRPPPQHETFKEAAWLATYDARGGGAKRDAPASPTKRCRRAAAKFDADASLADPYEMQVNGQPVQADDVREGAQRRACTCTCYAFTHAPAIGAMHTIHLPS